MAAFAVVLLGATLHAQQPLPQFGQGQAITSATPVLQPARPYRGLFGGGTEASPGGHLLALTTWVYQEYGTNQNAQVPGADAVLAEGWYLGVRGQLGFEKAGRYSRVAVRAEGAFRYLREQRLTTSPRFLAELAVDARTGARKTNRLRLTGSVNYEPYYILSIFPTEVFPPGGTAILPTNRDDLLFERTRYIYAERFSYDQQLSPRTYLSIFNDWRSTHAQTPAEGLDVNGVRVGARYGYRLSPHASLRLGYAYRLGNYGLGASQRFETHDVDVSVEYLKPLTKARTTTFGFGAGSSRVSRETEPAWVVLGNANLRHEFGAGWFIEADFIRSTQLVEGFTDPFLANTVAGSLGGFLGHRLEVLLSSGYSRGWVGVGGDHYSSRQGSARIRLALAKYMAVDAEGLLVQYLFGDAVPIPGGVPADLDRWAVRCNIALWLPLSR